MWLCDGWKGLFLFNVNEWGITFNFKFLVLLLVLFKLWKVLTRFSFESIVISFVNLFIVGVEYL